MRRLLLDELAAARQGSQGGCDAGAAALGSDPTPEVLRLENAMRDQGVALSRLQAAVRADQSRGSALSFAKASLRGQPGDKDRPLLAFVGVFSHPSRGALRAAARRSWFPTGDALAALENEHGVVVRFVLGKAPRDPAVGTFTELDSQRLFDLRAASLAVEIETWNDIVVLQHAEAPGDLSGKTLALMEAGVLGFDASFVVKADDDTWVNLPALISVLRARRHSDRLYMGCIRAGSPLHFAGTAYAHLAVGQSLTFSDPEPSVLPYASGQIYALSRELALHLVESGSLLRHFGNEDVSVGAWLIGLAADTVDEPRFCCPHCAAQTAAAPCVAIYQPECAGVCSPEANLPRVHAMCNASSAPDDWAQSKEMLAAEAAAALLATAG